MVNLNVIVFFDLVVISLISVAYLTLLERKVLAYRQSRKGPNKVSIIGILQPIRDAIKLALKESSLPTKSNKYSFYISPMGLFAVSLIIWCSWEFSERLVRLFISGVFILILISLGIYPIIMIGWSSNSKYRLIGAIRSIAQTISYEISLALILLSFLVLASSLSIFSFSELIRWIPHIITLPCLSFLWFISCVAETNRTPFDFSEGESELVSGFNTEYSSARFTLIFLGEYLIIIFFRTVCAYILGVRHYSILGIRVLIVTFSFAWVWIRATFPRFRYDKLINLAWKSFLPLSLIYVIWAVGVNTLLTA